MAAMVDNVEQLCVPHPETMRRHLEHLFGGYLDGYHEGWIELSWTNTHAEADGRHKLASSRWFKTDQFDDLIEEACRRNAVPMCNVYIGAALRKPDSPPFGRSKDDDAWALPAYYVDLDDEGATARVKDIYGDMKPTMIVVTGLQPHTRAQLWWKLDEPDADPATWPQRLKGLAGALGGDRSVCNAGRVMRLAGSIAWPLKSGRVTEMTTIQALKVPGAPSYMAEHIARRFPPVTEASNPGADTAEAITRSTNSLGLSDKITDGREKYMRDTVLAVLVEYIGENGAVPTAEELFAEAWPQYSAHVDLSRSGRGAKEFGEKCRYTIQRFERGELRGLRDLDEVIAVYAAKKNAAALAKAEGVERKTMLPAPPVPITSGPIKTVDFITLMTEDVVEEPDYIEPGFAGPGNFVLIAGPPKAQKSFLLQEILVGCAAGRAIVAGTFTVPRPLRVFYLQAEMNRKLLRKRAREMTFLTAQERALLAVNFILSERFHMILNEDGVKTAVDTIKAAFPDAPPDIIAIDPMANLFDQESENDNAQLMRFLTGRVERIRQAINPLAAVIMVHHATKAKHEDMARDPFACIRGAGALRGYYDSAIVIFRKNEETKTRRLHFELRSGESPEPMDAELIGGRFEKVGTSLTVSRQTCKDILSAIAKAWDAREPWSPHERSRPEGRYIYDNIQRVFGLEKDAVTGLVTAWQANAIIKFRERIYRKYPSGFEVIGSLE